MVSGTRVMKIVGKIFLRLLLLAGVFIITFFTGDLFHSFNENIFHYLNPSGFFSMASWAEWSLTLVLAAVFWSGILFGSLGKKIDYIFISLVMALALWEYSGTDNVTPQMYLGLIGVALLGNAIGYLLKLARVRWFAR